MTEITWGDTVRVKPTASPDKRPGEFAAVCGITEVGTEEHATNVNCPIGTTVYLIEFGDGSSAEVSGEWLDKVEGEPD